ncbi:hypothetical protein PF010_g25536 [Phytophthora fragariae]|uniref:Uncharacterized protein n=2 Tax=Phytophthora fragariae TaxID=53985 RepID=A0A6G0K0A0_9STRA|nr:hypothetical protein PF010_g25536 [Phytophthora fragariae]
MLRPRKQAVSHSPIILAERKFQQQPAIMAKFAFFAAILLVLGAVQLAQAEDVPQDFAPLDPTEGSGFVNTALEERCCL